MSGFRGVPGIHFRAYVFHRRRRRPPMPATVESEWMRSAVQTVSREFPWTGEPLESSVHALQRQRFDDNVLND